jgi:hypothetical protein
VGLLDVFDLSSVYDRVIKFLGPVGKLIDAGRKAFLKLRTIVERATVLMDGLIAEFNAWRHFKEDIKFKSRVVNLESAFEKTKALIEGIPKAWNSIVDIVKEFKGKVLEANPASEAEELLAPAEDGSGEGLTAVLKKFPKLAKSLERIGGVLVLVLDALESISKTIDDLQSILDEISALRREIESLDTIFLTQHNKRKRIKLADGKSIRIRLGKLHAAGL